MKTKRTLKALYFFVLLAFLYCVCVGCAHRVCAPFTTIHTTDTITICTTDTITEVAKDSALLWLLAECDSNNNVILSELACIQGERNKIKYDTYDSKLVIRSECDSLITIYKKMLKEIRDKQENTKVIIERPSLKEQISNVVFLFFCGFVVGLIFFIIIFRKKIFTF